MIRFQHMKQLSPQWRCLWIALGVMLVSTLSYLWIPINLADLPDIQERDDYSITDFYTMLADQRNEMLLDSQIVIVDIGSADRLTIAHILHDVAAAQPAVIGVDVTFVRPHVYAMVDSLLVQSLNTCSCPIVLAMVMDDNDRPKPSFLYDFFPATSDQWGVVNLLGGERQTIREIDVQSHNGIYSFPMAIARHYSPEAFRRMPEQASQSIYYPSIRFEKIFYDQVTACSPMLKDKIVLLGDVSGNSDNHITPLSSTTKGLYIHAYALHTILSGHHLWTIPAWVQWMVLWLLLLGIVYLRVWTLYNGLFFADVLLRLIQFATMGGILWLGYLLFVHFEWCIDVPFLFFISISLFVIDIWYFCRELIKKCIK